MIKVAIVNPLNGDASRIGTEGEIPVVVHPHPPVNDEISFLPFRQFFTDNGTKNGNNDMRVVASLAAPIDFYISSNQKFDIYIKTISIVISDAGATLSQFGNIGSLANGVEFIYQSQKLGDIVINESMKTNFDFVQQSAGNPAFGDGAGAFRAQNVVGTSEAYIPVFDLSRIFGTTYGVKLKAESLDRLIFRIKDNTSGVDRFDIVGFGGILNID